MKKTFNFIEEITIATNKVIKEIKKAINREYNTGRIRATRKHFK